MYNYFSTFKYCEILNILRVGICCADNIHYARFFSIQGLSTVAEKAQAGSAGDCLGGCKARQRVNLQDCVISGFPTPFLFTIK